MTTVQGAPGPAHDALDATLTLRLVDYLRVHWPEQDLTDRIASARHISTRQLYRLLTAQGITLGAWLR